MIIDTMYLFPLIGVDIKDDLLKAIYENRVKIKLSINDIKINLISLFELQAKASKLNIPPKYVTRGLRVILKRFDVIPFYRDDIIEVAHEVNKILRDYIDSIIISTGISLKENLITQDSIIIRNREILAEKYGVKIYRYEDIATK
ncbi:hypothetical protein DRN84_01650 [Candidatus Geothermarchaeota archaeon]|nr:MAG: hypothetical protein DRN87_02290 [Candidatus Geothermarchaeota archaeon]RLG62536.1 MAG: hypothetical protein DRN84_01650 [Candidatus Geothermarchaeota archaeon]HEW94047.1 hypothetical protein [Thermoprotei archaeon]